MINTLKKKVNKKFSFLIFFLRKNGKPLWFGFKYGNNKKDKFSILKVDMLLGRYLNHEIVNDSIIIEYIIPKNKAWKIYILKEIQTSYSYDVHFPFFPVDKTGNIFVCPPEYWNLCSKNSKKLDIEEEHFREYTYYFIKNKIPNKNRLKIYDPAGSTGAFLGFLSDKLPEHEYYLSDYSFDMVKSVRDKFKFDFVFVNDIQYSSCINKFFDIIFSRFLNHEVIHPDKIESILINLFNMLNDNGYIILLGHTPIGIDLNYFASKKNIQIIKSIAFSKDDKSNFFQYFVLKS